MRTREFQWAFLLVFTPTLGSAFSRPAAAQSRGRNADGDGLSDFQEMHKYCTDPGKTDTAGTGTSDGDWAQRREFSYSVLRSDPLRNRSESAALRWWPY